MAAIVHNRETTSIGGGQIAPMETRVQIDLDNNYLTGGYSFTPSQFHLSTISFFGVLNNPFGLSFDYNYTLNKLKILEFAGSNINGLVAITPTVDEVVLVTTNAGTLTGIPADVNYVYVTSGTTTGAFSVIPVGTTPLTRQVAINYTNGILTFLNTDAVTTAKVTYLKKSSAGNFNGQGNFTTSEVSNGTDLSAFTNIRVLVRGTF